MRRSIAFGLALGLALVACSALTSVDGLTGGNSADGGGANDASIDASPSDGAVVDAAGDAAEGDAGDAGPDSGILFLDDFNRPGGDAGVGNGWTQKSPGTFLLVGNAVERLASTALDYRDCLCYRPAAEDVLDVEVSIELKCANASPGYPQIWLRAQRNTLATPDTLDAYGIYVNDDPAQAILGRQGGNVFAVNLATITISPPLNTTDTFRLRLSATGTAPVALQAYVERLNAGTWDIIGQATYLDSSAVRLATPGGVAFSAGLPEATGVYTYDNFRRISH